MINHIIGTTFSYYIFRVIFFIYLIKPEQNGKYSTNGKTKGWKNLITHYLFMLCQRDEQILISFDLLIFV